MKIEMSSNLLNSLTEILDNLINDVSPESENRSTDDLKLYNDAIKIHLIIQNARNVAFDNEVLRLRQLILSNPDDIKLLKREYYTITGKQFKRKRNE